MNELQKNKELTAMTLEVMMNFFETHDIEAMAIIKGELREDSDFMSINTDNNSVEKSILLFSEYIAREMAEIEDRVEVITVWVAAFKTLYKIVEAMGEKDRRVADKTIQAIMKGEI